MILVANKDFSGYPAGEYPIATNSGIQPDIYYDNDGCIDSIYINFIDSDGEVSGFQAEVVNPYNSVFKDSEDYEINGDGFLWSEDFFLKDGITPFENWPNLTDVSSIPEKEGNGKQKGFTLWFTGLSGAGKTTIAQIIEKELIDRGLKVESLDGDVVRTNLSKGLGFSKEDRNINIKRIGFVCKLLVRNGVIAIASAISPYREIRDYNRSEIGNFVEVFVKCPLETCIDRDVKGLYKKALSGEIKNYTGVSDPYEEPLNPEVVVETDNETVEESAERVINKLIELGYII